MKPEKVRRRLEKALAEGLRIRVWRSKVVDWSDNVYVAAVTDGWVAFESMLGSVLSDGYDLVRLRDITDVHVMDEARQDYWSRVRSEYPRRSPVPDLTRIGTTADALTSASALAPLISVHEERWENEPVWIGRLERVRTKSYWMTPIDPAGRWEEPERFTFKNLTRIGVLDRYAMALAVHGDPRSDPSETEPA